VPQAFWHVVERIGVPPAALLRATMRARGATGL
jgi:hypothetical protein